MNIGVNRFFWIGVLGFSGFNPSSGIAGSKSSSIFIFYFIIYFFIFRERGREGERQRNTNVWLPLAQPLLGTWPATQTCTLTGNQTGNSLVLSLCSIHWATPARAAIPSLVFWGNSILFSTVAAPVCIPTNSALGFPFLCIFSNTCLLICYTLRALKHQSKRTSAPQCS